MDVILKVSLFSIFEDDDNNVMWFMGSFDVKTNWGGQRFFPEHEAIETLHKWSVRTQEIDLRGESPSPEQLDKIFSVNYPILKTIRINFSKELLDKYIGVTIPVDVSCV